MAMTSAFTNGADTEANRRSGNRIKESGAALFIYLVMLKFHDVPGSFLYRVATSIRSEHVDSLNLSAHRKPRGGRCADPVPADDEPA